MALIDDVKQSLRISSTAMDTEVQNLIAAAEHDLVISGVNPGAAYDGALPLTKLAIILYSKAFFGLNNTDSEKYKAVYDSLKTQLCLSSTYTE